MISDVFDGLLSGKYDSTKQRAVLLNGDRLRNYRSYTATMRLELLLTGRLVLTDAQFFDGLYFHWLAANPDELRAFENRMVSFEMAATGKIPLFSISVKCRIPAGDKENGYRLPPDLGQVAVGTFCKEFQFSSAEDDQLAEAVFDLGKDYSEKYLSSEAPDSSVPVREKPGADIDSYAADIVQMLESFYGKNSALAESWKNFTVPLKALFRIRRADKWGFCQETGQWGIPEWKVFNSGCLNQLFPNTEQTYIEKMKTLLDEAEGPDGMDHFPAGCRYFARIRGELNLGIPNRSKITMALSKLEYINNNNDDRPADKKKYADVRFRDFRQLLNERYNKLLAFQHGCKFLDLCDYTGIFELTGKITMRSLNLQTKFIQPLAELSWNNFDDIINRRQNELENAFHEWMAAYEGFTLHNISGVEAKLKEYLCTLTAIFTDSADGSNAAPDREPWNIKNTCSERIRKLFAQTYQSPYFLVGGGSFAPGIGQAAGDTEGNETCILCVEGGGQAASEKMAILRLRLDSTDEGTVNMDHSLNTLLAPICNPLNGGVLHN